MPYDERIENIVAEVGAMPFIKQLALYRRLKALVTRNGERGEIDPDFGGLMAALHRLKQERENPRRPKARLPQGDREKREEKRNG